MFVQVDGAVSLLEDAYPQFLKDPSNTVLSLVRLSWETASTLLADVKDQGVFETAKSYYDKYEPVAEDLSIKAFQTLLTVPFAHQVVSLVAPAALFGADKLNAVVFTLKEHHVPLAEYIPVLPVEKIHEVIRKETEAPAREKGVNGTVNGTQETETPAANTSSSSESSDSSEDETPAKSGKAEETVKTETAACQEGQTAAEKEVERTPKLGATVEAS